MEDPFGNPLPVADTFGGAADEVSILTVVIGSDSNIVTSVNFGGLAVAPSSDEEGYVLLNMEIIDIEPGRAHFQVFDVYNRLSQK